MQKITGLPEKWTNPQSHNGQTKQKTLSEPVDWSNQLQASPNGHIQNPAQNQRRENLFKNTEKTDEISCVWGHRTDFNGHHTSVLYR